MACVCKGTGVYRNRGTTSPCPFGCDLPDPPDHTADAGPARFLGTRADMHRIPAYRKMRKIRPTRRDSLDELATVARHLIQDGKLTVLIDHTNVDQMDSATLVAAMAATVAKQQWRKDGVAKAASVAQWFSESERAFDGNCRRVVETLLHKLRRLELVGK